MVRTAVLECDTEKSLPVFG